MTGKSPEKCIDRTRRLLRGIVGLVFAYILFLAVFLCFQGEWMYQAHLNGHPGLPAAYDARGYEVVTVETADGLALNAWYRPPPSDIAPVIIVFHGNRGHVGAVVNHMRPLVVSDIEAGFLLLNYREFGGNPGTADEQGLYADGRAAVEFLSGRGVAPQRVVPYGVSTGSAVAVQVAMEYPVAAVVIQSGFDTRVASIVSSNPWLWPGQWFIRDRMDNISKISNVSAPLLFLHGTRDVLVYPAHGRALFDAAVSKHKTFVAVEGAGHQDMFRHPQTLRAITGFLQANGLLRSNGDTSAPE